MLHTYITLSNAIFSLNFVIWFESGYFTVFYVLRSMYSELVKKFI